MTYAAVADRMLQDRELAVVHGRLRAPGGADDRALVQAISRVAGLGVPETVSLGGMGGRSLVVYPGGPELSAATGPCVLLLFSTVLGVRTIEVSGATITNADDVRRLADVSPGTPLARTAFTICSASV